MHHIAHRIADMIVHMPGKISGLLALSEKQVIPCRHV